MSCSVCVCVVYCVRVCVSACCVVCGTCKCQELHVYITTPEFKLFCIHVSPAGGYFFCIFITNIHCICIW